MNASDLDFATYFHSRRPRLQRIAYRMLGSVAEAEDVVQDAWLRWHAADRADVREPEAFLVRTVTRLALDVLKSARIRREDYTGQWLPEPFIDPDDDTDDITLPLMLAMERLSPLERAAFLLHDVFDMEFDEVAGTIGRDAAACRQLASRARTHLAAARPRFPVALEEQKNIATAFFAAARSGDLQQLKGLLADGVVFHGDGGGKRQAVLNPIVGIERVLRLLQGLQQKAAWESDVAPVDASINGLRGQVCVGSDGLPQTIALAIDDGRISAIYVVRNPDKLGHLGRTAPQP